MGVLYSIIAMGKIVGSVLGGRRIASEREWQVVLYYNLLLVFVDSLLRREILIKIRQ
jgi:hypothetical protein